MSRLRNLLKIMDSPKNEGILLRTLEDIVNSPDVMDIYITKVPLTGKISFKLRYYENHHSTVIGDTLNECVRLAIEKIKYHFAWRDYA